MSTYRLEPRDIERAAQRHYRSSIARSVPIWLALSALVVLLFACGLLGDARRSLTVVVLPLVLGAAAVTHIAMYFVLIPRGSRRQYAMHRKLQLPQEFGFDCAGLWFENDLGQNRLPWDHIHEWIESEDHFLLYPTTGMYYILPKRAFQQDSDIDQLRRLLAEMSAGTNTALGKS